MKAATIRKIERAAARAIEKAEVPGCVLWVAREGDVVYHEAFGEAQIRPHHRPVTTGTVFDLASLTKVLATTFALARLVEKGALDLSAPVASLYPPFAERDKHKESITFRHLLTHSAGLKAWAPYHEDVAARDRKRGTKTLGTPDALPYVLERIAMSGLIHEVGEASVYGDLGFITLGEIVERVDGRDLCRIFAEDVAASACRAPASFLWCPAPKGARSSGEDRGDRVPGASVSSSAGPGRTPGRWAASRARGLFGTAEEEVGRIARMIACSQGRGALLSQPVVSLLHPADLPPGSDWALSWTPRRRATRPPAAPFPRARSATRDSPERASGSISTAGWPSCSCPTASTPSPGNPGSVSAR
jgi:CubicO group peptidase (beta-lactamase class C family)